MNGSFNYTTQGVVRSGSKDEEKPRWLLPDHRRHRVHNGRRRTCDGHVDDIANKSGALPRCSSRAPTGAWNALHAAPPKKLLSPTYCHCCPAGSLYSQTFLEWLGVFFFSREAATEKEEEEKDEGFAPDEA